MEIESQVSNDDSSIGYSFYPNCCYHDCETHLGSLCEYTQPQTSEDILKWRCNHKGLMIRVPLGTHPILTVVDMMVRLLLFGIRVSDINGSLDFNHRYKVSDV